MRYTPGTGGTGGRRVRIGSQPDNEPAKIIYRKAFPAKKQLRIAPEQCNGSEAGPDIELQRVDCSVEYVRTEISDTDRIAVRRGLRDSTGAGTSGGTSHIFDDDRLPQGRPHPFGNYAAHGIDRRTGCKWSDEDDRTRRIILWRSPTSRCETKGNKQTSQQVHVNLHRTLNGDDHDPLHNASLMHNANS